MRGLKLWGVVCLLCPAGVTMAQTDACAGADSKPGCVLPRLYHQTGLTLPNRFHAAHFLSDFQSNFAALNSAIGTQLAVLPLISPASGFTYQYDKAAGVFVRSATSFGPILTERPETIGKGKVYFGISYQRFRFDRIDGQDLHDLPAIFTHSHDPANNLPNGQPAPFESDFISTTNNIDLKIDQVTLFGTVGLTDRLDLSVAVPLMSTRIAVTQEATINRLAPPSPVFGQAHYFSAEDPENSTRALFSNSGSASGIGDVILRAKDNLIQSDAFRLALAMDVRVPSGSEQDYLGSGAVGLKPFLAVSFGKRFSPHANLGYQWNGKSVLAGNIATGEKRSLPGQVFYSFGVDWGATKRLTLAFDYLGQTLIDAEQVTQSTYHTGGSNIFPAGDYGQLATAQGTYTMNSGAAGFKYNLFGKLLLTANLLFRLDDNGLRQTVTPLVGLSYAFGE